MAVVAALLAGGALVAVRGVYGLGVPLGPDPALWGLSASMLARGLSPHVAPGYPALLAVGSAMAGLQPWRVGGWVSLVFAAVSCGFVAAIGAWRGLPAVAAVIVGLATLMLPDALGFAFQLQPDAVAACLCLLVLAVGLYWEEAPNASRATAWAASGVALILVREHGLAVLPAIGLALVWRRRPTVAVEIAGFAALAGVLLFLGGATDWLPARIAAPLRESPLGAGHGPVPDYRKELTSGLGVEFEAAWQRGDHLAVWQVVLRTLVDRSALNLVVVAAGLVGWGASVRRLPLAALVALSPVLPLLCVWSQRRHTSVLLPVAVLGVALGLQAIAVRYPALKWPSAAAFLLGVAFVGRGLPGALADLKRSADAGHQRIALAAWMQAEPGRWLLGGQHNEVNLHLLWSRNNPDLPPPGAPLPLEHDGADWHTMWVAPPGTMPPPFTEVHVEGPLAVFRLEASPGKPRPCEEVSWSPGVLFTSTAMTAATSPECSAKAWFGGRPPPATGLWKGQPYVPTDTPR